MKKKERIEKKRNNKMSAIFKIIILIFGLYILGIFISMQLFAFPKLNTNIDAAPLIFDLNDTPPSGIYEYKINYKGNTSILALNVCTDKYSEKEEDCTSLNDLMNSMLVLPVHRGWKWYKRITIHSETEPGKINLMPKEMNIHDLKTTYIFIQTGENQYKDYHTYTVNVYMQYSGDSSEDNTNLNFSSNPNNNLIGYLEVDKDNGIVYLSNYSKLNMSMELIKIE